MSVCAPHFYPTLPSALASRKAGVTGMTLVAARDLAQRAIRICNIAPGVFDTPIVARRPAHVKTLPGAAVPHPPLLSQTDEFPALALHIRENPMVNGEIIRLDGAVRMAHGAPMIHLRWLEHELAHVAAVIVGYAAGVAEPTSARTAPMSGREMRCLPPAAESGQF